MASRALLSGIKLEKIVLEKLAEMSEIVPNKNYHESKNKVTVPQYRYHDIFTAKARVDFLFVTESGKKFFIECKNQKTPGSVDVKFPYYILNMQSDAYKDSVFIFVLNPTGIRKNVLEWLIKQTELYKFYIVSHQELHHLDLIFKGDAKKFVFLE